MSILSTLVVTLHLLVQVEVTNVIHTRDMNNATEIVSANILTVKLNERQLKNFWSKVEKDGPIPDQSIDHYKGLDACWIWIAGKLPAGYGQFVLNYKTMKAHRVSFLIANGFLNQGLKICHRCDVASCVNPSHLWEGTDSDNTSDRDAKGRQAKGDRSGARLHPERLVRGEDHWAHKNPEKCRRGDNHPRRLRPELCKRGADNPATKITEEIVRKVRAMRGLESQQNIAKMFGISQTLVSAIHRRIIWQHVT